MQNRIRRGFVDTDRGFVHIQESGQGERVLVFVTITSFGHVLLDHVLPQLAARGYRAIAVDLMGYGLSDKRVEDWSIAEFADNVEQAVARSGAVPRGYVCGHFAGLVGVEIGARAADRHEATALGAMILDGTPLIDADKQRSFDSAALPPPIAWTEDGAHAVAFWKRAYGLIKRLNPDMVLAEQPSNKLREAYLAYLAVASFEPGTARAFHNFDVRTRMRQVTLPTLVMTSDTDWNLRHHETWLDGLPNSRSLRLEGVHPLHDIDRPHRAAEYVRDVDAFFKEFI